MVLSAAEVGVFLCALTGRVMGISGNNTVGSVQTRSESKQRGGQADGGNISHHTGNGPTAARLPERHPHRGGHVLPQLGQHATLMCRILKKKEEKNIFGSKLMTLTRVGAQKSV